MEYKNMTGMINLEELEVQAAEVCEISGGKPFQSPDRIMRRKPFESPDVIM